MNDQDISLDVAKWDARIMQECIDDLKIEVDNLKKEKADLLQEVIRLLNSQQAYEDAVKYWKSLVTGWE